MDVTFFRSSDGAPYVHLGPGWPGFNETLSDAVGSIPPRGSTETSVSTYWIDRALSEIERMSSAGLTGLIQGGNTTSLVLGYGRVSATSDYELFDEEGMTVETFVEVMSIWRTEVLRVLAQERPEIAETYRRNPYPA